MRKSINSAWEIWDDDNVNKPLTGNPILRVARNAENQFMSLVHQDDIDAEAEPPTTLAEHEASDDIHADDDDDGGRAGVESEVFDRIFQPCRLCGKRRWFPRVRIGPEDGEQEPSCSETGMKMENSCDDPAIYDEITKFFNGTACITYNRTMSDGKLLNLSQLFRVVVAAGGIERLQREKKLTDLAKFLGSRPENASRDRRRLKAAFQYVFQQARGPSLRTLEEVLKGKKEVREAVALPSVRSHVCATLGLAQQPEQDELAGSPGELPALYSGSSKLVQSSDVVEVMKGVVEAGRQWQEFARRSKVPRIWASVVEAVVEAAAAATSNGCKTGSLVMLGNTGAGKSFLLDNVLRMCELDRSSYRTENRAGAAAEDMPLDAQQFLSELELDADGDVSQFELLLADADKLAEYVSSEVEEQEMSAAAMVRDYCSSADAARALEFNRICFLMPSGKLANSTTACSVSIRRSARYQLVLEYRTEEALLEEWRQYSTIKDSQNKEEKKRVSMMVEQVLKALPDAAFDLAPGQARPNRVNANAQRRAREFLSEISAEKIKALELHNVLGRSIGFAGAGVSAMQDRVLMRALLHNAQGMKDVFTHQISVCPLTSGTHPLLHESGAARVEFGQRTLPALKRVTVFGPFMIAPTRDSDWVDTAGCGDGDFLKQEVLSQELVKAESVIVLVGKNLNKAPAVCNCLKESHAMQRLVDAARAGRVDHGRVSVLCNFEAEWKRDHGPLMPEDMCGKVYEGVEDEDGNDGAVPVSQAKLHALVTTAREREQWAEEAETVANRACEAVPVVIPAFMYATSLMMHTDQAQISEERRIELLERTRIFEVLGMIEKFLQAGTVRLIDSLEATLDAQLSETQRLSQILHKTMPDVTPGMGHNLKKTEERFCETVKKGATEKSLAADIAVAISSAAEDALQSLDIQVEKVLDAELDAELRKKLEGQEDSEPDDDDDDDDGDAGNVLDTVSCFAQVVQMRLQEELRKPLLDVKKRVLQSVFDSSMPLLQNFFADIARALAGTETLLAEEEEQVRNMVEKCVSTRKNDQKSGISHLSARGLSHLRAEIGPATKAMRLELAAFSAENRAAVVLGSKKPASRRSFVQRCIQAVKDGLRKDMTVRDKRCRAENLNAGEDLLCKLGLLSRRNAQKRTNSLRDMAKALVTILQPSDVVGRNRDDLEQLGSLEDALCELRETLTHAKERWGSEASLADLGRQLAMDCRALRHMESFHNNQGMVSPAAPLKLPEAFVDSIPMHRPESANEGGYLAFDPATDITKALKDDFKVDLKRYPLQLQRLKERKRCPLRVKESNHIRALAHGKGADPDLLFKVYAIVLGESSANRAVRERLRFICAYQAMKTAPSSATHAHIANELGGALQYSERIRSDKAHRDLLALLLLVHFHHRPLNLYVPWQENPLRISPEVSAELGCTREGVRQIVSLLSLTEQSTVDDVRDAARQYTASTGLPLLQQLVHEGKLVKHVGLTSHFRRVGRKEQVQRVLDSFQGSPVDTLLHFDFLAERQNRHGSKDGADAVVLLGWAQGEAAGPRHLVFAPCLPSREGLRSARAADPSTELEEVVSVASSSHESSGDARRDGDALMGEAPEVDGPSLSPPPGGIEMEGATPIASPAATPRHSPAPQARPTAEEYKWVTLAASHWRQHGTAVVHPHLRLAFEQDEFRRLCGRFAQFSERWVGARAKQRKSYGSIEGKEILPYDDAFSHADDVLGLFDGVGEGKCFAGRFARLLADITVKDATPVPVDYGGLEDADYNRSKYILDAAHAKAVDCMQSHRPPRGTAATAVVLSLLRSSERNWLHSAVHGDSQWALFREQGPSRRYACISVSTRMHHGEGTEENPPPYQVSMNRDSLFDPGPCTGAVEVHDGDMVLLGCDGVFDALKPWSPIPPEGVDVATNEKTYATELQKELTDFFQTRHHHHQTAGANGGESFLQAAGKALFERVKSADKWPHTDDLTLMLARVSVGEHDYAVGRRQHTTFLSPHCRERLLERIRQGVEEHYTMWT